MMAAAGWGMCLLFMCRGVVQLQSFEGRLGRKRRGSGRGLSMMVVIVVVPLRVAGGLELSLGQGDHRPGAGVIGSAFSLAPPKNSPTPSYLRLRDWQRRHRS